MPGATYVLELECSKLHPAAAEASLTPNTAERPFYMPCTASATLYNPRMLPGFASLCKAIDSLEGYEPCIFLHAFFTGLLLIFFPLYFFQTIVPFEQTPQSHATS